MLDRIDAAAILVVACGAVRVGSKRSPRADEAAPGPRNAMVGEFAIRRGNGRRAGAVRMSAAEVDRSRARASADDR
jgi:hypothetical protein